MKMKKILVFVIVLTIAFAAKAQRTDNFFAPSGFDDNITRDAVLPVLPLWGVGFFDLDQPATPLGSGLAVLTVLGAGYALARKRKS